MSRFVLVLAGVAVLLGAHGLRAQTPVLPLASFSSGFGAQSGSGKMLVSQVGGGTVGRSTGTGKVVSSGFLPGAVRWSGGTVDVPEGGEGVPAEFSLAQNYPNPFNPSTRIRFQIPERAKVTLRVFDLLGREVRTLVNEDLNAGSHETTFDASGLASGVYIYRMIAGNSTATRRLLLLK